MGFAGCRGGRPGLLYLAGRMELDSAKLVMIVSTITWFVSSALWMGVKHDESAAAA